jgi:death-on-curing protein
MAVQILYGLNGHALRAPADDAYDLIIGIASGEVHDVTRVAAALRSWR